MRRAGCILLLLVTASSAAGAAARAIRDVRGVVEAVSVESREDGGLWTVISLRTEDGEVERLGLASHEVLEAERFRIAVGDEVRARFFTDRQPQEVQRIRNESTGHVLRLRCLHGDPLRLDSGDRDRGSPHRRGR